MRPVVEVLRRSTAGALRLDELDDATLLKLMASTVRLIGPLTEVETRARGLTNQDTVPQQNGVVSTPPLTDAYVIEMWAVLEDLGIQPTPPPDRA